MLCRPITWLSVGYVHHRYTIGTRSVHHPVHDRYTILYSHRYTMVPRWYVAGAKLYASFTVAGNSPGALLRHHDLERLAALVRRVFLRVHGGKAVGVSSEAALWSVTASSVLWNLTLTILLTPCSCIVTP